MANFNTDDDYSYYDPEDGFDVTKTKKKRKISNPFSFLEGLGNLSNDKIIYIFFIIIWILILLNIEKVLDWLFYLTFGVFQYVILGLILFAMVYFIWKKIL